MISDVKRAAAALEKGRTDEALDALLTAWRARRATELADAIDALAHAFPVPKFEGEAQSEWMALAREGKAGDVYALVASVVEAGAISGMLGRVEMLCEREDDPRIAHAFATLALEPPTTSSSNFPVWTKMFAAIEKAGDARVLPILEKRLRMKPGASKFWPKLTAWCTKALKKVPTAPKLTKEEATAVAAIVKAAKKAKPVTATKAASPTKATKATTATPAKSKKGSGDPLATAIAAVKDGDLHACLDALLEGWRERRLPQYAAAIDRVTALHDEGLPYPGGSDSELHKEWLALAAKKRPMDVGRLAGSVTDGKPGDADKRLEMMMTWPADPRIARPMFQACISNSVSDRGRTWTLVGELLAKNFDARLSEDHFEAGGSESIESFAETRGENKARRAAMRKAGPAALKVLASVPKEPSPNETSAFDELNKALDAWDAKRPSTERKMLEAILASPKDNGPSLVYADWLTERGHPRGELIVLQCSEEPDESRINELIEGHARSLIGPAQYLAWHNLAYNYEPESFHRGMLRTIELRNEPPSWFFANEPLLWFLDEIEPHFGADDTAATVVACTRSLKSVGTTPGLAARLAAQKTPLQLERFELGHARETEKPLATMLDGIAGPGLSRVKDFEFFWGNGETYHDGIPDELAASPLFGNLESLRVATTNLGTALDALKKHKRTVPTLSLMRRHYLEYRLDVTLDKKLTPIAVSLHLVRPEKGAIEIDGEDAKELVKALKSLKLSAKTKLKVAKDITFAKSARTAVSKVVALA